MSCRALIVSVSALALTAAGAACNNAPLKATTIQVGKSLNSDNSVGNHSTTFKKGETIYVSLLTEGRGTGTITARWKYGGQVIGEPEKKVSYNDDAATEFHLQGSGGWRGGEYEIEMLVDGKAHGSRKFRVEE